MKRRKEFLLALLAGAILSIAILWSREIWLVQEHSAQLLILCDALAVPGCLLLLGGGLLWAGNMGAFGGLGFARRALRGDENRPESSKNRAERYHNQNEEKRRRTPPYTPLLLSGMIFLVPAILLIGFYYMVR